MKSVNEFVKEFVKECDKARCSMNIKQEFHMNLSTAMSIMIAKDAEGRPLYNVKPNGAWPNKLLGFSVMIDSSIPENCIDFVVSVRDTITRERFHCL